MREQNIGHIPANEGREIGKHLQALTAGGALALVIDTKKIKLRATEGELNIFVAKQLHASLREEALGSVFGPGINFVIAIASKHAEGRAKITDFLDAIGQRVG